MSPFRGPRSILRDLFWILGLCVGFASSAFAYEDTDANKIDDRIDAVHQGGWNLAFVNQDPSQRMRIGVENPANVVFAVYVVYDHPPTALDRTTLAATGVAMVWPFQNVPTIESRATYAQVLACATLPGVVRVEAVPVDYALNHYGSRVVRARDAKGLSAAENYTLFPSVRGNLGFDGTGIVIAILDTGVNDDDDLVSPTYPGHESLQDKFLGGGEFWCGQAACATAVTASENPQDHGAEASSYHATHVAGSALGKGGLDGFFAGVAPGARLVDCKVLSDAGASVGGSNRGLDWVISNKNRLWDGLPTGSVWQGIDVVSMSLGSTECATGTGTSTGTGSTLINTAVDAGLVVVIATGNDSSIECIASPAAADKSIAVGASQHNRTLDRGDDRVTTFSNEGPRDDDGDADHWDEMKPSVIAPGAGIISADGNVTSDGSSYQQLSGTSMSAPHVSGCVALILQANPSLTPLQVRAILQNTAEHNIPTAKANGDRGQDPYGLDPNYDPSCGWGLVDVYAACKEALNSTSGVQVVKIGATPDIPANAIRFRWITQREYAFQGFRVYRAPSVGNAPGTFALLTPSLVTPAGHPDIQGVSNRTPYEFVDSDPSLTLGQAYWYRVDWVDGASVAHAEPPVEVAYGTLARIATAHYQVVHNAVDNDLTVRIGSDYGRTIGGLGAADFEVLGPGETAQDSAVVLLPAAVPANTGTSTVGTVEHYWSVGFKQGDPAEGFLPPSLGTPWFLDVTDGGFVNRNGRVTAFSIFVNDTPGSATGQTYVTDHQPLPAPLVEGGAVSTTLWIPEQPVTGVAAARFGARLDRGRVALSLELTKREPGWSAKVFRATAEDLAAATTLTPEPVAMTDGAFEFTDTETVTGTTYWYWVEAASASGAHFMNGPVSVTASTGLEATIARAPVPNPARSTMRFAFVVGNDAGAGNVATRVTVHDVSGREVKELVRGVRSAGEYDVVWDMSDASGRRVAAGTYFLNMRIGRVAQARKLVVVN